ncbi:hypothetical protein [Limnoraphis robusta]|uniref:hypothetical protein n=1 Tax=Limnoraphis robusta TaxID=1118279 RepID=UPI002B1EDF3B|nr:hypothetical protein [Limnoraphis robusta]MEA5498033.1 hypothetical protein [Limnoraphis robusta BA-68 BA1]
MNDLIIDVISPQTDYGDVNVIGDFITIGTDRRAKTPEKFVEQEYLQDDIRQFLPDASTGSFAVWDVPDGEYLVSGQLFTKERSESGDSFGYWADGEYFEMYTADDLIELPGIGKMLDVEAVIPVINGKLALGVWDTEDNSQTSMWKIDGITPVELNSLLTPPEQDLEIEQGVNDQILLSGFLPNDGQIRMLVEFNNPNQLISFQELQGAWQHQQSGETLNVLIDYISPEQSQGYDW